MCENIESWYIKKKTSGETPLRLIKREKENKLKVLVILEKWISSLKESRFFKNHNAINKWHFKIYKETFTFL